MKFKTTALLLTLTALSFIHPLQADDTAAHAAETGAKLFFQSTAPLPDPEINPEDPFAIMRKMSHNPFVNLPGIDETGIPFSLRDAIVFTIENQVALELSILNIEVQKGVLQSAAGPFDYYINGSTNYIDQRHMSQTSKDGDVTSVSAGINKRTRPGTFFNLSADVDKVNSPFTNPRTNNSGAIRFNVQQPLLRGFLNGINWMQEQAAALRLYASYYDDFQNISDAIYATTFAYWEAVGAQNALEVQQVSVRRITEISAKVNQLIENDQLPRSAFYQTEQQESDQQLALVSASERVYATVQALRFAMGDVSVDDMTDVMLNLTDDFSIKPLNTDEFQKQFQDYFDYALRYNYDIQASTLIQMVNALILKGADNECLPELNVVGQVVNSSYNEGNPAKEVFSPMEMRKPQTNWSIGINLNVPLYNDAAIGFYRQQKASYAQSMLNTQLLQQVKLQRLRNTLSDQINLWIQLVEADKNVEISQKVYDDTFIQFYAGLASLFDFLSYQNALTNALLRRTDLRTRYMQNIALVRFLTASTFLQGEDNNCIEILDITTLPEFDLKISDRPHVSKKMQEFLQRRDKVWKKR